MHILTVIPISRGIPKDDLTYFTKSDVQVGSIVSIPLRKKIIYGLVTGNKKATEIKSELKSLTYSIKKIDKIESHSFLSDEFIKACGKIADYNAGSIGSVLSALLPTIVLENSSELNFEKGEKLENTFYETGLLQSDDEERYATYKSLIREEFAKGRSVFFCLPTTEDLLNAKTALEKGIEKYTYSIHSGLSKKEIINTWKKLTEEKHPVLIIGTGSFLSIPRGDLGTIILEKESSRAYKMQTRPYIDIRDVAEYLAKELGIRLVLGDTLLRVETLWEEKKGRYAELAPIKFRSLSTASCEIISLREPADTKKKEFSIFSDTLKKILKEAQEKSENTFLFCGRKGLFPMTICSDCGTVVSCKNCGSPTVLYAKKGADGMRKNLFVCNHCGERDDSLKLCDNCKGWRLNPLGIGIDRVRDEIEMLFPDTKVFIMDKDHIKTHKQAEKVRDSFLETPGSIMIGTEMALTYINRKIENTAVVSIDSYFSIPDFQINEKIFHILLGMRAISERKFIIQTRQENTKIFDHAIRGNLMEFYRDEIEDRKAIGYPPFSTYVKITIEGEKNTVKKEMAEIVEFMKPFELQTFDAFNPGSQNKHSIHGLISIQKGKWPDPVLLSKLRIIQPHCAVRIDPATLL
jgi:primosomal protein N'